MARTNSLTNFLTDVAAAIKEKKGDSTDITAADFDTEIASIQTGADTSDATAAVGDILTGKSAYISTGKVNGTMPNNGSLSYTPSDSSQSIPAGYTSGGTVAAMDITTSQEYQTALAQSNTLLYGTYVPKVTNGLLYSLNTYETFSDRTIDTNVAQSSIASAYTIFITINPTAWNNFRGVMGNHGGYNQGLVGFQYESGAIKWCHIGSSSHADVSNTIGTLNQDYDIILTFGSQKLNIWCNDSQIITNLTQSNINPLNNIIIGQAYASNERYFAGKLGYCYIYNRVLSSDEIEQMQQYIEQVKEGIII